LIRNGPNKNGLMIKAGENPGDIAFHIEDDDATFQILDVEAQDGYFVYGKTYANCLATRGIVYGWDNQYPSAPAADANLQNGVYRMAGVAISPYNIGGGIVNQEVNSTTAVFTTSTTAVLISGMTATPAAGTYMVTYNGMGYTSANNQQASIVIYKGGAAVASSVRMQDYAQSNKRYTVQTQVLVTVNGSEAIEARYYTASGTFNMLERSMILVKVAN
jgi:hypothetical protein